MNRQTGKRMIKIGFVIWSLGLGGAEQVVIRLATGLVRRGHEVTVFTLNDPGVFADKMTLLGIPVISVEKRGKVDFAVLRKLAGEFRSRKIEVVHTHLWGANFWGRIAARMAGVPVVIAHEHGMQPWRKGLHFFLDRILAPACDLVLFASREVMEGYRKKTGIPQSKCRFLPNGVACDYETEDREFLRRHMGWLASDRVILSVGRLSPEKGHEDLLRAFAEVVRLMPRAKLVLVGDGPQRGALQELGKRLGLDGQVVFAGFQDDVSRWLIGADVYVQPSRREGLPLAVLEAMVLGLPVIATRVGDMEQVIESGQEGYLVPPEDPEAIAEKLLDVLQHPDLQGPVTAAARRTVQERFSLDRMVEAVEEIYREELAAKAGWRR